MNESLANSALICGLAPLIPLPFVDAYAERKLLEAAFLRLAVERGVTLDADTLKVLTEDRSSLLLGCLGTLVIWPIKKLFRTFFYFLTIKDVIDTATRASHKLALLSWALDKGLLPGDAKRVRDAMDMALSKTDHSPVTRVLFRRSRPGTLHWQPGQGTTHRLVGGLHQHGGGQAVLEFFQATVEGGKVPDIR